MKKSLVIFFVLVYATTLHAQTKSNLEKFYQLIDNSVNKTSVLVKDISAVSITVTCPPSLELLKPKVLESFSKKGFIIKSENYGGAAKVSYLLSRASVEYSEAEKDGFFGNMICERNASLNGIVSVTFTDGIIKSAEFKEHKRDTINVDEISYLEDSALAFTQGSKPEISFLSNLLEPVLVVAVLVTTIVLLFSVRGR